MNNKPIKMLFWLGLGVLLIACQAAPVRRNDMISAHPEWHKSFVALIKEGYLAKGMNQEQVEAAWGRRCLSCSGTTSSATGESWEYPTQIVFFDLKGKVSRWAAK